jgi:hypothetical protein
MWTRSPLEPSWKPKKWLCWEFCIRWWGNKLEIQSSELLLSSMVLRARLGGQGRGHSAGRNFEIRNAEIRSNWSHEQWTSSWFYLIHPVSQQRRHKTTTLRFNAFQEQSPWPYKHVWLAKLVSEPSIVMKFHPKPLTFKFSNAVIREFNLTNNPTGHTPSSPQTMPTWCVSNA